MVQHTTLQGLLQQLGGFAEINAPYTFLLIRKREYEGQLKNSEAKQDDLMECDQMRFIFIIVSLAVLSFLPPRLQYLDLIGQMSSTADVTS